MPTCLDIRSPALHDADLDLRHVEIVPQIWRPGAVWRGYEQTPRPHSGLILPCSTVKMTYTLPDGRTLTAGRGDVIYAPRGCRYLVSFAGMPPDSRLDAYTVNFDLADPDGCEVRFAAEPTLLVRGAEVSLLEAQAEALSLAQHGRASLLGVKARGMALLDAVIIAAGTAGGSDYPIRRGVEAMLREWNQNEHMDKYAQLCGVGVSYFSVVFKRWAGVSPVEYRNRVRIAHAKTMLRSTGAPIGEIARAVGIDDSFYFSRLFRRIAGVSPTAYRRGQVHDPAQLDEECTK